MGQQLTQASHNQSTSTSLLGPSSTLSRPAHALEARMDRIRSGAHENSEQPQETLGQVKGRVTGGLAGEAGSKLDPGGW